MPYIITTTRRWPVRRDGEAPTRRAVATLDEAREEVWNLLDASTDTDQVEERLSEAGGTIGPLPDGTVIEVAPTSWFQLAKDAGVIWATADSEHPAEHVAHDLLDAFNGAV